MFHHLIKEDDVLAQCIYCGTELKENIWESQIVGVFHYKVTKCSCGTQSRVRCKFSGSGHDDFNDHKTLDVVVKEFNFQRNFFN